MIVSLSLLFFIVSSAVDFSKLITKYFVDDVNNKIYGRIAYKQPKLNLNLKNLDLYFKNFLLLDQNGSVIFHANNLQVKWSLENLFDPNQKITLLKADQLVLRASKGKDGKWNFDRLVKQPGVNKLKFSFHEINVPNLTLSIRDEASANEISYSKVKVFFKTLKKRQLYTVDIEANTDGYDTQRLFDSRIETLPSSVDKNFISIKGNLNLSGDKNFLLNKNNLDLIVINLEAINLQLLNSILDFKHYTDDFNLVSKLLNKSDITFLAKVSSEKFYKHNFRFNFYITNFMSFNRFTGDFIGDLNSELITVSNLDLGLGEAYLKVKGTITKWQEKDPSLNLNFDLVNLDLSKIKASLIKTKFYSYTFIYDLLASILGSELIEGNLKLGSTLNSPEYTLNLKAAHAANDSKKVFANLKYSNPTLLIKTFDIPLEQSKLNLSGAYNLKTKVYDFQAFTKDAAINSLSEIVKTLPISEKLKNYLMQFQLEGNADLNLHIYSGVNLLSKQREFHIKGPVNLRKTIVKYTVYPVIFENMTGDLELNDANLKITNLTGYINNDFFETRGNLNYRDLSLVNIELASPKIEIADLDNLSFFDKIRQEHGISDVSGTIKDIYFAYNKNQSNVDVTTHLNLDSIEILLDDMSKISKIKGLIDLKNKVLRFSKLNSSFGNGSIALIDGFMNQDLSNPDLIIQGKKIPIKHIAKLINTKTKYKIDFLDGYINPNLNLKDKDYLGTLDLNYVDFVLLDSKFSKYSFQDLKGKVSFDKGLLVDNLNGKYGNSYFRNLYLKIDKYKSTDRTFNLHFNGDLYANELEDFVPTSIKTLLSIKGYIPATIAVTGNKQKQTYMINASLDKVEKFTLSNWLEYQKNVPVVLKAKFIVTPHLIVSEDCKIVISNSLTDQTKKTRIKSTFQVEEWSSKDKLTYYTSFAIANKIGNADLANIEPQIITLKTLNLSVGKGSFACDTIGDLRSRQTICDIKINSAVAKKYGIGDLNANKIDVGLLSITEKPLSVDIKFANGDWNGIPFKDLDFDLKANGDYIYIDNLKAVVKDGTVTGKTTFNVITEESTFNIKGDKVPAHELVQGIWGLGAQVPEGVVSGVFQGKTKGMLPEPMFFNLEGTTNMSVKNGKLSQLKSMQRILTAVNTLSNFDINNVFQILITYKGGSFNDLISSLEYDKGKISSKKLLIKADEIEMDLNGYLDYNKDQLYVEGKGLIPKRAKSILQTVGVGEANLGNVLSMAYLNFDNRKNNRFFEFKMEGPISDIEKSSQSLRNNFKWLEK